MDNLKQLLYEECRFKISDGLFDRFVGAMSETRLKNREVLIPYGKFDSNAYVLKSGIIRWCWFDGEKEKTYGFSTPGTVMISYHSHFMRLPSYFQLESCGESVVGKVSKKDMDEMMERSHEFSQWMAHLLMGQLYANELKYSVINGLAKERFISLLQNRPEIIARVPMKTIASYLGVTPEYLYRLKKQI
jgi:CRP-like cAMP-binding protein